MTAKPEGLTETMTAKPTRLWKVSFAFEMYVLAGDGDDAKGVASRNATKELMSRGAYHVVGAVAEVADRRSIDPGWLDSRPYSTPGTTYGDLSCDEALREIQAVARKADLPGQQKLFEG
jgi:hypothetical protein